MNQQSLDNAIQLAPDLWEIKSILVDQELDYLMNNIECEMNWTVVNKQQHLNRQQIEWTSNGICDWLWCKLAELDFTKFQLKFRTAVIWRDQAGYTIKNHYDNDQVHAAMQLYLSQDHPGIGTWFGDSIEIPFQQNTGYLMNNRNRLIHGMKNSVPEGYSRLSFYALFDHI